MVHVTAAPGFTVAGVQLKPPSDAGATMLIAV
jgi:hypothetical protein